MTIWKPTKEQLTVIRDAAKKETGLGRIELQPGIRLHLHDVNVEDSMNLYRVDLNMDNTDLSDFSDWNTFKKGVELTEDGRAMVDFYCYSRYGLESNIIVYYEQGKIIQVDGTGKSVLFSSK